MVAFDDEGLRISVPAGWNDLRSNGTFSGEARTLFYLSNQVLNADCATVDGQQRCELPVSTLDERGVLVLWATARCAGAACELPGGERRLIGGREAARGSDTTACAPIDATEQDVYAVTVTPQRVDWIVICARHPGPVERAAVQTVLDTVDWRTP